MTLIRLICWLVAILIAVAMAVIASNNQTMVSWSFWPTPFVIESVPLYLPVYGALFVGLVVGFLMSYGSTMKWVLKYSAKNDEMERALSARDRAKAEFKEAQTKLTALEKRTQTLLPAPDSPKA